MDFIMHHTLCFASHLGLLWLWRRAMSKVVAFEKALLAPVYMTADFFLAVVSLFRLTLLIGGVSLLFLKIRADSH